MTQNVVVSRIQPQLVRKRQVIPLPKNVQIVVQPSRSKAAALRDVKQTRIQSRPKTRATPPPSPPPNAAVSQKPPRKRSIRKKTQVQYVTRNVSPESITKINALRNTGRNKILLIIGNGPSIVEAELDQLNHIANIDIMSINKPDDRIWPTTHWAFFDHSQMRRHESLWTNYAGNIFNSTSIRNQKAKSLQIKNLGGKGFSRNLAKGFYIGRSSVYAAMQIALWMGYDHTYIFGCDMNPEGINGKLHFYGDNPDVEPSIRGTRFKAEAEHYSHAARILSEEERSLYTFCTEYNPWQFVKQFGLISHKTAVSHILEHSEKLQ